MEEVKTDKAVEIWHRRDKPTIYQLNQDPKLPLVSTPALVWK